MPSLFSRAAFRAATSSDDEASDNEPKDIFRHSERSYDNLIAEEERKRQERVQKHKVKVERREQSKAKKRDSDEVKREASAGSPKRRRVDGEETAKLLNSIGLGTSKRPCSKRPAGNLDVADSSPLRRSQMKLKGSIGGDGTPVGTGAEAPPAVIELGGSSDVEEIGQEEEAAPQPVEDDLDDESDEELAALARQARARRQQQQDKTSMTPDIRGNSPTPRIGASGAGYNDFPLSFDPDPAIKLFVSSPIPNTRPIVIVRRMSQRLQEVRVGWCKKMEFPDEFTGRVFLIHRMRRFYDMTTVKSLGLNVEFDGQVTLKGAEGKEGVDQLHLEAVTQEIFDKLRADQAKEALKRSGQLALDAQAGAEEGIAAGAAAQKQDDETLIRLVLKAKNKADFKLKVKPVGPPMPYVPLCEMLTHTCVVHDLCKDRRRV